MIVVADTSVILNLCCVKQIDLLSQLFGEVIVPPEVAAEFQRLTAEVSRFAGLALPAWVQQRPCRALPQVLRTHDLDPGEAAALGLALEIHADAVLVDERRGYEVARQLGLNALGILSILLRAKVAGLLPRVAPVLDDLRNDAQFWLSERVRLEALRLAGENN